MDPYKGIYNSIYRGVVESNKDPKNLGRCQVRVPSIHGEEGSLPWARPIVPSPINSERGTVNIPDVDDIVWVMFEAGEKRYPLYFGGTYATQDITVNDRVVDIYIDTDNKISYDRDNKSYTINVGDNSITITEDGITITGETTVEGNLTVNGELHVTENATFDKDLEVTGIITCGDISINGSSWIPGGSLDIGTFEAMTEEELQEILDHIDENPDSFMYSVETIKALMAAKGVTYDQNGYVTLVINGVEKKVRTDCSGLVSAMVSAYTGKDILMSSYGYVSATSIEGFSKVTDGELKAGDICARNGHVEIYAYRKDGVDYVYSGGSTGSLNSAVPTKKGQGSYDVVWRPDK